MHFLAGFTAIHVILLSGAGIPSHNSHTVESKLTRPRDDLPARSVTIPRSDGSCFSGFMFIITVMYFYCYLNCKRTPAQSAAQRRQFHLFHLKRQFSSPTPAHHILGWTNNQYNHKVQSNKPLRLSRDVTQKDTHPEKSSI